MERAAHLARNIETHAYNVVDVKRFFRHDQSSEDIQGPNSMAKGSYRFGIEAAYALTANFPRCEIYCLTSQMRRAAISIPANIAEGFTSRGDPDKIRFLNMSRGSLEECRYYMILVQDLGYGVTKADIDVLSGGGFPSCSLLTQALSSPNRLS